MCTSKCNFCEKDIWQISQTCGFNPSWFLLCLRKFLGSEKVFSHLSQANGLSPVCILMCTVSSNRLWKDFGQNSQENGLSPLWILLWSVNEYFVVNLFSQISQANGFLPISVIRCLLQRSRNDLFKVFLLPVALVSRRSWSCAPVNHNIKDSNWVRKSRIYFWFSAIILPLSNWFSRLCVSLRKIEAPWIFFYCRCLALAFTENSFSRK